MFRFRDILVISRLLSLLYVRVNASCWYLEISKSEYASDTSYSFGDFWELVDENQNRATLAKYQFESLLVNQSTIESFYGEALQITLVDSQVGKQVRVLISYCQNSNSVNFYSRVSWSLTAYHPFDAWKASSRATRFQMFFGSLRAFYFYKPNHFSDSVTFHIDSDKSSITVEIEVVDANSTILFNKTAIVTEDSSALIYHSWFFISSSKNWLRHYFPQIGRSMTKMESL